MAKYLGSGVLDNGLDYPRSRIAAGDTVKLHVIKAYALGDSYATVVGNSVGNIALAAGDLVLGADGTSGRKVQVGSKNIAAASAGSGASPDLHIAIVNETASAVNVVTDETTNQVITAGNPITVPTFAFKMAFAAT